MLATRHGYEPKDMPITFNAAQDAIKRCVEAANPTTVSDVMFDALTAKGYSGPRPALRFHYDRLLESYRDGVRLLSREHSLKP